jgi:hypothetical protein
VAGDGDEGGQPFIATTWSLNALRQWGVASATLGDTAQRLEAGCRWDYDDLPYWGGEVDCCINSFTLANGGWNCEWIEGSDSPIMNLSAGG